MLICSTSTISEIVAAHLVATGYFNIQDIIIVPMHDIRNKMIEATNDGNKHTIICAGDIIESDNITYIDPITYFNDKSNIGGMIDSINVAIKDLISNEYDMYSSTFNNYIMHDIETINSIAYTGMVKGYAGSATDQSRQLELWNSVNNQLNSSIIKKPHDSIAIINGKGYVRYMARAMMHNDKNVKIIVFIAGNKVNVKIYEQEYQYNKIYVYFRDGMTASDYIPAHAWYSGYCEYGQFSTALSESATKNMITCMCSRLVENL